MIRLVFAVALTVSATPLFAQEQPALIEQSRCWLGAMSYSPGATVRAGNAVMVCGEDFVWTETADWASGCLHDGKFYSVGGIQQGYAQQPSNECQPDGTWSRMAAGE